MNQDHDDDFDDDDDYEITSTGKRILKDGRGVRVPIQFMDAERKEMLRQKYQGHRLGFRYADADDANDDVEAAHAEYCQWLRGAHRAPVADADYDEPQRPTSLRDAKAEAERAYEERSAWLRNAHKGQS